MSFLAAAQHIKLSLYCLCATLTSAEPMRASVQVPSTPASVVIRPNDTSPRPRLGCDQHHSHLSATFTPPRKTPSEAATFRRLSRMRSRLRGQSFTFSACVGSLQVLPQSPTYWAVLCIRLIDNARWIAVLEITDPIQLKIFFSNCFLQNINTEVELIAQKSAAFSGCRSSRRGSSIPEQNRL